MMKEEEERIITHIQILITYWGNIAHNKNAVLNA